MKSFSLLVVSTIAFGSLSLFAKEPKFEGLGSYTRKITSDSPQAQKYFNQGLGFYHGFNHGAAIRAFQEAAKLDPKCAMAHWGIALANGPHINFPMVPPPAADAAWKELQLAQQHAEKASPVERALIDALGKRYANPQPEDRKPLDEAYAAAMREVWKQFPNDPDAGALFAEAMMDLRPWDQWTRDGQANPGTEEVIATLDAVLKLNAQHPFANHLYIHAVEASRNPELADAAADRLRSLQPGLAHNVHMPSHIDIRRGRWQQAIDTNVKAVEADRRYRKIVGPPTGLLPVYAAHNHHMLAYGALMTGQREVAMKHARAMVAEIPAKFVKENAAFADGFFAVPLEVLVRFGRWDEILAERDKYPPNMPFVRAFHHAARATAYAAKGDTAKARKEQALFVEGSKLVPKETQLGNNYAATVISLATHMLEGEILVAEQKGDAGVAELQTAVKEEDALKYDEPPAWMIPLRHSLGAVLMKAKRFAEAEQVYRDDLARLPDNGWSLFGLAESLREQKKNDDEVISINTKFQKTWAKADVKITTSCLCQARK
jgi:tetratricopeptide (TPR) repeat protein